MKMYLFEEFAYQRRVRRTSERLGILASVTRWLVFVSRIKFAKSGEKKERDCVVGCVTLGFKRVVRASDIKLKSNCVFLELKAL